jgi:hypothetical protein
MRYLFLFILSLSCSHKAQIERPHWVSAIRSGEEALKVSFGSKTFYRRIAGSSDVSKQTSCNLVIMKAEEDLRKEYPSGEKLPYAVEVLYYDPEYKDCAVTISTSRNPSIERLPSSEELSREEEASDLVLKRSEAAARFALTGLTRLEFEKFTNEKVTLLNELNLCSNVFRTNVYSIHGTTHVCWKSDVVSGYCTLKDRQCWTRTP